MIRVLVVALVLAMPWCSPATGAPEEGGNPAAWLGMLENPEFGVREEGCERLRRWAEEKPDEAREMFLDQVLADEDPEVRMRCRELLQESVVADYRKRGKGYVGIRMLEMQIEAGGGFGVRVIEVQPDTPAEEAGLKVGDVIVGLGDRKWDEPGATLRFQDEIMGHRPGDKVKLNVKRRGNDELLDIEVKLAQRPPLEQLQQLLWQGMRQDPEQLREQQEERKAQEEKRFFDRWLAEQMLLRKGADPATGPK